jgi:hypothetical protein
MPGAPQHDPRDRQMLAMAMISQAIGQFGQGRQANMERQALSQLLSGRAAQAGPGLEALTSKGAPGLDPRLAGPALGMTQPGGMAQPRIPGLIEGGSLTPEMGRSFMEAGGDPYTLARLMPQQIDPYQQANLDLQRQGMDLDREQFGQQMDMRRAEFGSEQEFRQAKLAQDAAGIGVAGAPKITDVRNARLDFGDVSEPWNQTVNAYEKITASLGRGTAAGDMAGIFSFMKTLDPTSTIREGEYASARNTTGIPGYILNYYNQAVDGTLLSPQQREEFSAVAGDFVAQQRDLQLRNEQMHREQAELAGIDPERVVTDFVGKYRDFTPAPPAPPSPGDQAGAGRASSLYDIPNNLWQQGVGAVQEFMGGGAQAAPEQTGAPVRIDTLPPVQQRRVGQVYQLPSGSRVRWAGEGWEQVD